MPTVNPIPSNYPRVSPYLIIQGATAAIEFYKQVLGATERMRIPAPGDTIGHAELQLGESVIMLADECPEMQFLGPAAIGGTPVTIMVYVSDCDAVFAKATAGGATVVKPLQNQFYGDRSGTFKDPWGHIWTVASRVEELSSEEIARRASQFGG